MLANIRKTLSPAPVILQRAQVGTQMNANKIANICLAIMVGLLAVMTEIIVIGPVIILRLIEAAKAGQLKDIMNGNMASANLVPLTVQLASTVLPIIVLMLYVRFAEKRSLRSMGFVREKAVSDYLIGMAAAFAMFSACVGICLATGTMTFDGYVLNSQYGLLALYFIGFLVQGMSEEVVCRGFIMTSVGSKSGTLAGMLANSLLFGLLHLGNSNVTFFAIANIILFGVLMSVIVLKLQSIWLAGALHSIWNFVQGNFYGIRVSGIDAGPSVLRCTATGKWDWLSGGSFGMEGGAATTMMLAVAILIVLLIKPREETAQAQ